MNPVDRAQEIELADYERNQAKAIQPAHERASAEFCEADGCGERIPEARRRAVPGVREEQRKKGMGSGLRGV